MNEACLSWFRETLTAAIIILASVIVQGCRSDATTSEAAINRNLNKTETSATSSQCDPNYSGCVPIASDVDCAGARGNGPAYVKGPVKINGKDIYKLDRDGDGLGCE